jgi:GT2 family glycosyltransferase
MSTTHIQRWPVEVSIIIPVFNKADLTEQCLKTLASVSQGVTHEIIVVDNASTDSTPRLLASRPSVRGIRNVENRGFAGACNQGAAAARGQHLLFLNNDTVPFPGWIEALAQEFRQHPAVAVAGAKLLYASGLVQHAGVAFTREARDPFHPYRCLQSDDPRVNRRREVQAVTAACMLIRREWFERGGRFNEEYRNGYEDLDLCLNIRRLGGLIIYQPKSVLCHLESQTSGRMKFDGVNRALFYTKWSSWLLADEDAYYLADDYRLVYREEEGRRVGRLVRIAGDADRRAWRVVAQVQRLAAEGRWNEVIARLEDPGTWPEDAAVRRWAATLCFRLDRPMAGNAHLRASLELEPSAEAVLQLAQHDLARARNFESCYVAGLPGAESARRFAPDDFVVEAPADAEAHATGAGFASRFQGTRLFLAGDYAKAGEAFEHALLQGADSREAVFGMAAAAWKMGDLPLVQQCCDALLAQRDGDPLARRLRQLIDNARTSVSVPTTTKPHAPLRSGSGDPPNQPTVSIITLAFNQIAHTRKCLESLAARTVTSYEIIAVDNGSQDRTSDLLHAWCGTSPRHIVIRNENNRGFAAGNNQALTLARGEFVVLLNNDTVVTDGWLERMLAVLERHPDTGIVGPMSNHAGRTAIGGIGELPIAGGAACLRAPVGPRAPRTVARGRPCHRFLSAGAARSHRAHWRTR